MLVTPQLSAEIEKLLPQTQAELVRLAKEFDTISRAEAKKPMVETIRLNVGDLSLLIQRAINGKVI